MRFFSFFHPSLLFVGFLSGFVFQTPFPNLCFFSNFELCFLFNINVFFMFQKRQVKQEQLFLVKRGVQQNGL